ncbi:MULTISPECIES: glutathione S-transferase family protein [Novosphingobium]|uniref:glutathione S-transferase family protein n=1 Tax=Novosphingobium TaxID=165696 RepID=UPI001CD24B31|nr:glutathione S-transferase family protein [Novosphingobium percolationis]MCH7627882.1 glutathione S-transferase family protein [Pseudomonadota bacterium]
MTDLLLHQYDSSPFSEKVRVCLGIKGLAWGAVDQPVVMPKPELLPLTGGYRKIPVLQVGADIYCDSVLIVRELEARHPAPGLFPSGAGGLASALAEWTDRSFFQAAVAVIFAHVGETIGQEFIKDREALSGAPFNVAAMKAAYPHMATQLRAHAALVSQQLADGRAFLEGERPGLADANAFYNLWFVRSFFPPAAPLFEDLPGLADWYGRVVALGHGQRREATRAEALAAARAAQPSATPVPAGEPAAAPGDAALIGHKVVVSATDYGRDPIAGTLVAASALRLVVRREDADLGAIQVHVPRIGFALAAA